MPWPSSHGITASQSPTDDPVQGAVNAGAPMQGEPLASIPPGSLQRDSDAMGLEWCLGI